MICIVCSVLSVAFAFKTIQSPRFWFEPTAAERRSRVVWVNLWLVGCWLLFTVRRETQFLLDRVGIRGIYINSVLMSLTYIVPMALLPVYVFHKEKGGSFESQVSGTHTPTRPSEFFDPKEKKLKL